MAETTSEISHLIALIEASKAEAQRLGPGAETTAARLDLALAAARALLTRGGEPEAGVPMDDLTTVNDQ